MPKFGGGEAGHETAVDATAQQSTYRTVTEQTFLDGCVERRAECVFRLFPVIGMGEVGNRGVGIHMIATVFQQRSCLPVVTPIGARGKGGHGVIAWEEAFEFGGGAETAVGIGGQKQRADAVGIARKEDLPGDGVMEHTREDSVDRAAELGEPKSKAEEGEKDDAVTGSVGYLDAVAFCQGLVVIDFPVTDKGLRPEANGLVPEGREPIDREARKSEEDAGEVQERRVLGAAGFQRP